MIAFNSSRCPIFVWKMTFLLHVLLAGNILRFRCTDLHSRITNFPYIPPVFFQKSKKSSTIQWTIRNRARVCSDRLRASHPFRVLTIRRRAAIARARHNTLSVYLSSSASGTAIPDSGGTPTRTDVWNMGQAELGYKSLNVTFWRLRY